MSKLKELQKWIKSFQDVNGFDPSTKSINLKIVELLKEEVSQTSLKSYILGIASILIIQF